jgi:hypothetical protein
MSISIVVRWRLENHPCCNESWSKYVYLDHGAINDDEKNILEVFTGQMHTVDITNAYQCAPVIDDIIFLEGIESLEELTEKEYGKEIIGSDN